MRQPGRCLTQYRELRQRYDILTIAKTPELWDALMNKLAEVVSRYLLAQIDAGVDVVQLFDSWVGALGPSTYKRFVQPSTQRIFEAVKKTGTPSIHFGTGTASLLELMAQNDIEIGAREQAEGVGIQFARTESLNTSPLFIKALAAVVQQTIG
jgi:uroporphyrinogen-III decarboxylase